MLKMTALRQTITSSMIFWCPTEPESYAQGAKTMRDSNKLELTAVPATQKSNPPALAPLNPPSNVTSLDKGLENGVIIGIYPNPLG